MWALGFTKFRLLFRTIIIFDSACSTESKYISHLAFLHSRFHLLYTPVAHSLSPTFDQLRLLARAHTHSHTYARSHTPTITPTHTHTSPHAHIPTIDYFIEISELTQFFKHCFRFIAIKVKKQSKAIIFGKNYRLLRKFDNHEHQFIFIV